MGRIMKFSLQKGKGFKKSIGFYIAEDGEKKQKMFWLGQDEKKAEILGLTILIRWKELKNAGVEVWDHDNLKAIKEYKDRLYEKGKYKPEISSSSKEQGKKFSPLTIPQEYHPSIELSSGLGQPVTFYGAIDKYVSIIKTDTNITEEWKKGLSIRLNSLKDATKDLLLKELNKDAISSIVKYYQKRPKNKNTGQPISITTAKIQIHTLKRVLLYLIDEEIIEPIKGLNKLFKSVKFDKTNKDIAKQLKGNPIFELDDLVLLYHNSNPQLRGYILLGLNFGFTQKEISNMLVGMVDFKNKVLSRFREKTDFTIKSQWLIWEETLTFLKHNIKPTFIFDYKMDDDDDTILYRNYFSEDWQTHGEKGHDAYLRLVKEKQEIESMQIKPEEYIFDKIVYINSNGIKIDTIASAWARLRKKLGKGLKNSYSFKSLRKTGADMIQQLGGVDIAQVYLSHTPTTVLQKNYTNPQFQKLAEALNLMRNQLQPIFENVPLCTNSTTPFFLYNHYLLNTALSRLLLLLLL